MNIKKSLCLIAIACLMWNLSLPAESISVKLKGKLALVGILSGLAYLTHALVKHDTHTAETLQSRLGRPEHITQIQRGFNQWDIHHYREESYYFLNNRFIRKKTITVEPIIIGRTSLTAHLKSSPKYELSPNFRSGRTHSPRLRGDKGGVQP